MQGAPAVASQDRYHRLSLFDPLVRTIGTEIYDDLGKSAVFNGGLFHDDATLSDYEDASPNSVFWAYAMAFVLLLWSIGLFVEMPLRWQITIVPGWHGALIGTTCLLQIMVSMVLDRRYDHRILSPIADHRSTFARLPNRAFVAR